MWNMCRVQFSSSSLPLHSFTRFNKTRSIRGGFSFHHSIHESNHQHDNWLICNFLINMLVWPANVGATSFTFSVISSLHANGEGGDVCLLSTDQDTSLGCKQILRVKL